MASTSALAPGTDTRTRASSGLPRRAVAVVRCGADLGAPRVPPGGRRERGLDGRQPGVERAVVLEPQRDDEIVGRRLGGTSKPITVEHLDVERGGHGDLGRGHAGGVLHGPADLEQGHRVGVRAGRSSTWVRGHAASAPRSAARSRASRAPRAGRHRRRADPQQVDRGGASRPASRGRPARRRARAAPRRAGRSPSSVAESRVVRPRRAADRDVDVGGGRPRRRGAPPASRRARRRRAG